MAPSDFMLCACMSIGGSKLHSLLSRWMVPIPQQDSHCVLRGSRTSRALSSRSKRTRRVLQQANTQNPAAPVKRCDEPISCDPAERSPAERLLQSVSWRATQKKNSGRNPGSTVCGKILFKTESMTDPVDPTSGTTLEALAGLEMDVEGGLERARKDLRAMVRRIWWGGC